MTGFDRTKPAGIGTRCLRDRLRETTFENREWIGDMAACEGIAAGGGPHGFAGCMVYGQFRHANPVECAAIAQEPRHATYTPPETYRPKRTEHDERKAAALARWQARQDGRLRKERRAWRAAVGQP